MENIFESAKWIWAKNNAIRGDVCIFDKMLRHKPSRRKRQSHSYTLAQSRLLFLSVNGKSVSDLDGGMNGCYDRNTDIARYLVKGLA